MPVVVSIPHYGRQSVAGVSDEHFADPAYRRFPQGYTDAFAAEIYGDLHHVGATVVATPYSRLFVDVNRPRDDFEVVNGNVQSMRGVVRTHIVDGRPIFGRSLSINALERRLTRYYDPYHHTLEAITRNVVKRHRHALILDAHTGSEKGMGHHEIIIGTRGGKTADVRLRNRVSAVFRQHGFEVHHDVPGYSGAYIVRRFGRTVANTLHAIQIEVNSRLLMTVPRREYFARIDRGEDPGTNTRMLQRLHRCMHDVVDHGANALVGLKQ